MHRYTEHIASDLDPEAPPDPEKVAAELGYANALIAAIHGTGGEFSNVLSGVTVNGSPATGDDYDTYDDYSAGIDYGGDPSDLSDDRVTTDDSDYGSDSDSGGEAHSTDTNSRFTTWSKRIPSIFHCLYGEDPVARAPSAPTSEGITCCPCSEDKRTVKLVVDVYDIAPAHSMIIHSCKAHVVDNIIRAHLFPATPLRPHVVFSIKFIRLYQSLFNVAGISATNMALVIQHLTRGGLTFQRQRATHSVSDQLHRQLKAALTWLTVVEQYCDKLALEGSVRVSAPRPLIEDDDLDLQLRH
ncbi:hypothetical protein OC834_006308 [Tilletia horrida]|nr:hypothetical protein OC834_006308 [Tilletia horrida]